jgi:hypothetical protein
MHADAIDSPQPPSILVAQASGSSLPRCWSLQKKRNPASAAAQHRCAVLPWRLGDRSQPFRRQQCQLAQTSFQLALGLHEPNHAVPCGGKLATPAVIPAQAGSRIAPLPVQKAGHPFRRPLMAGRHAFSSRFIQIQCAHHTRKHQQAKGGA